MSAARTHVTVAHLCLANAHRDEQQPLYRLGMRFQQFMRLFHDFLFSPERPHVVSIKELRACMSPLGSYTMTAHDMVLKFAAEGRYAIAECDPVKLTPTVGVDEYRPFYLAQLYDPRHLVKLSAHVDYDYTGVFACAAAENAPHFGACALTVEYAPLCGGVPSLSERFSVTTHHFHLKEDAKLRAARKIASAASAYKRDHAHVHIGDFNLFRDGAEYANIRAELTRHLVDATTSLMDQNGRAMYGTFYPFPHDKPPVAIARPEENSEHASRLDYAFVTQRVHVERAWVLADMRDESGTPLSDHLPLLLKLML